jgi:NADH-quinone oxidoreductase subunit L
MNWQLEHLWLIPGLPLFAAAALSVTPRSQKSLAAALTIGAMALSFLLAASAFIGSLPAHAIGTPWHFTHNFDWFQMGDKTMQLGWMFDPLTAVMVVMVTFVSLLIFIFSVGYMAHDENFTRFFCFLSLFAAAMLGLLIANNLLLLFMCWELVGLASYLLIGFWYHKPSAAAAAKKAFITTRVGDVVFFLGILYLYWQAGTLLFYDNGHGCLENSILSDMAGRTTVGGMAVTTAIGLLIFCGAIGKSGQFPLHVWLPDAMEGPTPVSALIHAATMVAAGVFLIGRVFPLLDPGTLGIAGSSAALTTVTWVGAFTAAFAACIAVAQTDIKRILAYSTVSQLGFMMMGLGAGGVAVGIFHLITHAFFKALLFLGSGSVIHGCHEEQDIRKMGGLKKFMPVTFLTYAVGMLALAGFPLVFSGFWSKDAILHAAHGWKGYGAPGPFYLGVFGALLTAFYMTRQVCLVFFGKYRGEQDAHQATGEHHGDEHGSEPHESPAVMTIPLVLLAVCAIVLGFFGTPAWPWFQSYLETGKAVCNFRELLEPEMLSILGLSTLIVFVGIGLGWYLYGRKPIESCDETDVLEKMRPDIFHLLRDKFYVDEFYEMTVIRFNGWFCRLCRDLDYWVWSGAVFALGYAVVGLSWVSRYFDEFAINRGFDEGCNDVKLFGGFFSRFQDGRLQKYLRVIGVALVALGLFMLWGCGSK